MGWGWEWSENRNRAVDLALAPKAPTLRGEKGVFPPLGTLNLHLISFFVLFCTFPTEPSSVPGEGRRGRDGLSKITKDGILIKPMHPLVTLFPG